MYIGFKCFYLSVTFYKEIHSHSQYDTKAVTVCCKKKVCIRQLFHLNGVDFPREVPGNLYIEQLKPKFMSCDILVLCSGASN